MFFILQDIIKIYTFCLLFYCFLLYTYLYINLIQYKYGWFLFLFIIVLFASFRIVRQNHIQVVEFLGKYKILLNAGLNILIHFFERVVTDVNLAFRNQIFQVDTVSSDKVIVKLKANLIYGVEMDKVVDHHYKLVNPLETLSSFVENYVRSFVSTQTHEELGYENK